MWSQSLMGRLDRPAKHHRWSVFAQNPADMLVGGALHEVRVYGADAGR